MGCVGGFCYGVFDLLVLLFGEFAFSFCVGGGLVFFCFLGYLFYILFMVRWLVLSHFLICVVGFFRCLAAMMSARLSSEIGLTTNPLSN